ncbi:hypothetical protein [Acidianus bottle-shaped virus 3 strain ABV3]|uniref:Uncharacterized protein n=1 Tax=Acidianus bottle-shaped virus 3 strain ABV3 TaxID=1732174 RepID=A0A0N9NI61_9VIRU|nr:hypothetical protein AVU00_gp05 [Acidianus bottle-shaped virus 3 strain ABV3]ALG96807.1 hypothetical protein [Acidianus bottle-shaped virus 3 strain ABV3]
MSLVSRIMDAIEFQVTGKVKKFKLPFCCRFIPGYALSGLSFNGHYVKGEIGITYKEDLLTTFSSSTIYIKENNEIKKKPVKNKVHECCLFINTNSYFHLADLIPAYLIKFHQPFYLFSSISYGYFNGERLYTYKVSTIPHYVFEEEIEPTEELDDLLYVVGVADAYKRGYFEKNMYNENKIKDYIFKPYLYFAYYLKMHTTLLPPQLEQELERKIKPKFINEIEIPKEINEEEINSWLKKIDLQNLLIVQ